MEDIKNIEDLVNKQEEVLKSLTKMFLKTLEIMEDAIVNKTYVLNINKNILDSHIFIIFELCKDLGLEWIGDIKLSTYDVDNPKYYIFSTDFDKTLDIIRKIKLYTLFQTNQNKGRA